MRARVWGDARCAGGGDDGDGGGDVGVVSTRVAVAFDDDEDGVGEDEGGDARRGGVGRGVERVRRTGNIRRRVWVSRF